MKTGLTTVTAENLDEIRESMPARDQAEHLEAGCETWGVTYEGGQRGQMTRWPSGRGAVCTGGASIWGDWTATGHLLADHGTVYDRHGATIGKMGEAGVILAGSSSDEICRTIDRMSESDAYMDPDFAADALAGLPDDVADVLAAIDRMLADTTWDADAQPYEWLRKVRAALAD